jgi:polyferredoxin
MLVLLADLVLALHFAVVAFVVGGLAAILLGRGRWRGTDRWSFRLAHLAAIGYVAAQQWLGAVCPLTTLEAWLRTRAGQAGYERSFVAHWLQRLLFYEAPDWVFTLAYTAFALLVAAAWWWFPPRRRARPEAAL